MKTKIDTILIVMVLITSTVASASSCKTSSNETVTQPEGKKGKPSRQVNIVLPKAQYAALAPEVLNSDAVVLSALPDSMEEDEFYIGLDPIVQSNLARRIGKLLTNKPPEQQIVYIRNFSTGTYDTVLAMINSVREAGYERIGLVVEKDRSRGETAAFYITIAKTQPRSTVTRQEARSTSPVTARQPSEQPSPKTQGELSNQLSIEVLLPGASLDQTVKVNNKIIPLMDLPTNLAERLKQQPNMLVVINAPAAKIYADVVSVIDFVKKAGAQAIALQLDPQPSRPRTTAQSNSNPPLITAVKKDDLASVNSLLARGADVNSKDRKQNTALVVAARYGHTEIVRALLAKGATDVQAAFRLSMNAEIAQLLLEKGADINEKDMDGLTFLMEAARVGRADMGQFLLAKGADANARDNGGITALMWAAYDGSDEIFEALLRAKAADMNARANNGYNAFIIAARQGNTNILQILLGKGVDVNVKDKEDTTALMLAAQFSNLETVRFLLARGADVNARDRAGKTALGYAMDDNNAELIELLKKAGGKE